MNTLSRLTLIIVIGMLFVGILILHEEVELLNKKMNLQGQILSGSIKALTTLDSITYAKVIDEWQYTAISIDSIISGQEERLIKLESKSHEPTIWQIEQGIKSLEEKEPESN